MLASCLSHPSVPFNKNKACPVSSSTQTLLKLCFACFLPSCYFFYYFVLFFQSFSFSLFFPIKGSHCLQLFGCRHGGQKFWHCVVWMPYFHSTACLELWFVRSLACRGHFLPTVLESLYQNTDWQERRGEWAKKKELDVRGGRREWGILKD